jgi:Ca-activated chloride channel family protein
VRIGIVAFAGDADMMLAPTTDREAAYDALDHLQLRYNTAIGSGRARRRDDDLPDAYFGADYDIFGFGRSPAVPQRIARNQRPHRRVRAAPMPAASYKAAAIVLLTDGRQTIGLPVQMARATPRSAGLRVYTVGFGDAASGKSMSIDGASVDVSFDEEALKRSRRRLDGVYFHASHRGRAQTVYRTLSGNIVLERKRTRADGAVHRVGACAVDHFVCAVPRWRRARVTAAVLILFERLREQVERRGRERVHVALAVALPVSIVFTRSTGPCTAMKVWPAGQP